MALAPNVARFGFLGNPLRIEIGTLLGSWISRVARGLSAGRSGSEVASANKGDYGDQQQELSAETTCVCSWKGK